MIHLYSNLSDSVHYNRSAVYLSPDIREIYGYAARRAAQLKEEMESVLQSDDCIIGFTLNQIADNPIFYQPGDESEALFALLLKLLQSGKAFISTYNRHTASSYALNGMISGWKRICDDDTDDLRYVSSLIDALADIKGDPDAKREMIIHYSDAAKRAAHDAMFGIDRLVTISDGNVCWNSHVIPIEQYLADMRERSRNEALYGYYTGLRLLKEDADAVRQMRNAHFILSERMLQLEQSAYRPNVAFVRENHITIATVILEIIRTPVLERIFTETIDSALEKRIRKRKDEFLSAAKTAFEAITDVEAPNRSKMYERAFAAIEEYLKSVMGYNDNNYRRNAGHRLVMSFFFQVIDFCYNLFNCLLTFGMRADMEYRFYPYHTQKGNASDESAPFDRTRKGVIVLTGDQLRERIQYTVADENGSETGTYLSFANAKAAAESMRKSGTKCSIRDRQGAVLDI